MKLKWIVLILVGMAMIPYGALTASVRGDSVPPQVERTYATDADFEEGVTVGVEITEDQLQLSSELLTLSLPFIWVPNDEGTVSKVHTETGDELGRYRVAPPGLPENGSPSRTTVDLEGNVWVGLRTAGTVVKIGLCEAGQCIGRNEDGIIQTSRDVDGDGNITGDELLPWGEDECVLFEVVLVPGHEGTYTPGTYEGSYDTDYWGTAPRSLAVDAHNNLWVGTGATKRFYYIDGSTGEILNVVDVSPWGHEAYGATIDRNGIVWSVRVDYDLLRIDPSGLEPIRVVDLPYGTYAITQDYLGHLFVTGWESNKLYKLDIETDEIVVVKDTPEGCARGVTVTPKDNHVWVADSCRDSVVRYDNDGNLIVEIGGLAHPTGVAIDAAGKIWTTDVWSEYIHRIDPETNVIDLSKRIVGGGGHYSYSDMTGVVSRTITTKTGTWSVTYDSDQANTPWGTISWTASEPQGTLIKAEARSSHDRTIWSAWETTQNGVALTKTPDGRYLEIRVTLQIAAGEQSPVLYDLTVKSAVVVATHGLTISSTPGGSVTAPGEGTFTYDEGTVVSLVAESEEGHRFVNWTGDVATLDDANAAETFITVEGDYAITANFGAVGRCFIATAAYGTPMAEELQILREFRDGHLLKNPAGQALVGVYYRVSPPMAGFITEHPVLKPIVRAGLMPAVAMSTVVVNTSLAEKTAATGLLALLPVVAAVWATRSRGRAVRHA